MTAIESSLFQILIKIEQILAQNNCQAYLVGGFIRDWFLCREIHDIDIAINKNALLTARLVASELNGDFVDLDSVNQIARVIINETEPPLHIDFSTYGVSIEKDLSRRDFTINAIANNFHDFIGGMTNLIDPYFGVSDLEKKYIRIVSTSVFREDPTRLLRALRLATELNFSIELNTEQQIVQDASKVTLVSGEKQREEFLKIISLSNAAEVLRYMDKLHLLTNLIPELADLKEVTQPKEHYWDVFNHSIEIVAAIEFLLHNSNWKYGDNDILLMAPWSEHFNEYFNKTVSWGSNRKAILKIGGLLHDIAKPQSKTIDINGRMRFIGHAKRGSESGIRILQRMRFSNQEIKIVEKLIYYHLRPVQMANSGLPTSRAIFRYFRDAGETGVDILFLALADYLAARGPGLDRTEWKHHTITANYILEEHQRQQEKFFPAKLIDGNEIMATFNLTSGPQVGKLLRLVQEALALGEVKTREDAIIFIKKRIDKVY